MGGDSDSAVEETKETTSGDKLAVNIRCSNGSKFSVQINFDSTVGSFKDVIAQNCDIPADRQRLIYKGRILKDDQTLTSYGLEADHTVHLIRGFAPAASSTDATVGANPTGIAATTNNTRSAGSNEGLGSGDPNLGASLFPGLGLGGIGASNHLFGSGLPGFEQVHQQLSRDPNIMREIMNLPAIQNLMNNPEVMQNMIMNNPQIREIIDRNPELGHILNDPSTLRQTLEAARNPELMREMMRNTDRAMSNIESSPEGFNMLRRMHENFQEPFLNATTMTNQGNGNSNPFEALLGNQGGQTRDQTTNPSTTSSEATAGSPSPNTNPLPNPWSSAGPTGGAPTNSTRSASVVDTWQQAPMGLEGVGISELEGSMLDPNTMTQLMQNPAISQMMQSLLSNPQYMNQFSSMLDSNSQSTEMMQNPEILRQLSSPETMQQLLSFQQALMPQINRGQSGQDPGQTGAGAGAGTLNSTGMELLMNMFGGLGTGNLAGPNRSNVPPEELYATQLTQLQEMGFFDTRENIQALIATAGNVNAAVERLLGSNGQ